MKTNSLDFDAQALREKILDLAMRGKLVEQDPNDEPASILLEKIKVEKAKLVKEGKIKKSKALPEITDEEKPFDIPDSWEWVRLGDVAKDIRYGFTASAKERGNSKLVRITDIQNDSVNWNNVPFCDVPSDKIQDLQLLKNDILIARTGGTVGKSYKIHDIPNIAVFASYLIRIRLLLLEKSDYMKYVMQSPSYWTFISKKRSGTGQPNVNATKLSEFAIPLPPLEEQSRIAAKIAQLFALLRKVESSTQQYAKLQTLLKSKVLDLAMRGKLVKQDPNDEPASILLEKIKAEKEELIKEKKIKKSKPLPPISDEEKPFEIPDSWEWVRLGEILALEKGSIRRGPFGSSLKKAYFVPKSHNTYKVYEQGNAINHTIDYGSYYISAQKYDELKSFAIRPGDVIISGAGTIGKTYILPPESPEGVINQALIRIRLNNKLITNDFFLLLFKQKVSLLNKKAKGTAIKNMFSIAHMKEDIVWALPPISEQNRIVKQLQEISKMM